MLGLGGMNVIVYLDKLGSQSQKIVEIALQLCEVISHPHKHSNLALVMETDVRICVALDVG